MAKRGVGLWMLNGCYKQVREIKETRGVREGEAEDTVGGAQAAPTLQTSDPAPGPHMTPRRLRLRFDVLS